MARGEGSGVSRAAASRPNAHSAHGARRAPERECWDQGGRGMRGGENTREGEGARHAPTRTTNPRPRPRRSFAFDIHEPSTVEPVDLEAGARLIELQTRSNLCLARSYARASSKIRRAPSPSAVARARSR